MNGWAAKESKPLWLFRRHQGVLEMDKAVCPSPHSNSLGSGWYVNMKGTLRPEHANPLQMILGHRNNLFLKLRGGLAVAFGFPPSRSQRSS